MCATSQQVRPISAYSIADDPLLFPSSIPINGRYILTLIAGYFDESTDADSEGFCFTVAGFVTDLESAAVLEMRWRDLLTEYEIEYFKASELNAGEGQFKKFRDDPKAKDWKPFSPREKQKFIEIKTRFTDVIVKCRGLHGVGAIVVLPDYERILTTYPPAAANLPRPYFLCQGMTLMHAGLQTLITNDFARSGNTVYLRPIFDSHEMYSGQAKRSFDDFCEKNPIPAKYLLPLHYETEQQYLMLQAADNLAFEARKILFNETFKPELRERVSLTRIKEKGDSILQLYKFDYTALKAFIDRQIAGQAPLEDMKYVGGSLWELRNIFYAM